jgi:hypothetical protein
VNELLHYGYMGELDWRLAKAAQRWEDEYGDFSGELAPTPKLLPHETRYDDLRAARTNFSQEVRQLGTIGLAMGPSPDQSSP